MSKSINSNAMDSLLQGLTGKTEEQEAVPTQECPNEAPSPTRRKEKPRYEVISTMVDPDVMSKVRTIADIEGVAIKEITAGLLGLTKQDMTMKILNEPQNHVNAGPVVTANSLR